MQRTNVEVVTGLFIFSSYGHRRGRYRTGSPGLRQATKASDPTARLLRALPSCRHPLALLRAPTAQREPARPQLPPTVPGRRTPPPPPPPAVAAASPTPRLTAEPRRFVAAAHVAPRRALPLHRVPFKRERRSLGRCRGGGGGSPSRQRKRKRSPPARAAHRLPARCPAPAARRGRRVPALPVPARVGRSVPSVRPCPGAGGPRRSRRPLAALPGGWRRAGSPRGVAEPSDGPVTAAGPGSGAGRAAALWPAVTVAADLFLQLSSRPPFPPSVAVAGGAGPCSVPSVT